MKTTLGALMQKTTSCMVADIIETGRGTSNVHVVAGNDHDLLLTANRESGEAAVFIVTDD